MRSEYLESDAEFQIVLTGADFHRLTWRWIIQRAIPIATPSLGIIFSPAPRLCLRPRESDCQGIPRSIGLPLQAHPSASGQLSPRHLLHHHHRPPKRRSRQPCFCPCHLQTSRVAEQVFATKGSRPLLTKATASPAIVQILEQKTICLSGLGCPLWCRLCQTIVYAYSLRYEHYIASGLILCLVLLRRLL